MTMKKGDRIEVVKDDRKGVVTDIQDSTVYYEDEDGFSWHARVDEVRVLPDSIQLIMTYSRGKINKQQLGEAHVSEKQNRSVVVDLHADKIIGRTKGMQPATIKAFQLKEFHNVMCQYRKQKGKKIVFIHGKGDGILKNEIRHIVENNIPAAVGVVRKVKTMDWVEPPRLLLDKHLEKKDFATSMFVNIPKSC